MPKFYRTFAMSKWLLGCALLCHLFEPNDAVGFSGIPGEYCAKRSQTCCPNRNDQCTVPILQNHVCYCDMFCDRAGEGNDCCPDFNSVCKFSSSSSLGDCMYNGVNYTEDDTIRQNCNKCHCTQNGWQCGDVPCLIQEHLLLKLQNGRFTWTARNYSKFWGRTLNDGLQHRLGTLFPERTVQNMNQILIKPRLLLRNFDAREKWPNFIHDVQDQGDCASSWSQSTTATSADRLAIITDGRLNAPLSAQQLLSCNQHRQRGCEGGYLDRAWWYIRKLGVVSEECYPYVSGTSKQPEKCFFPKSSYLSGKALQCPSGSEKNTVYKMTPSYRMSSKEEDIMTEIMTNGPVQATFVVYDDFFMYSGGVYQHLSTDESDDSGYHSVRLIGWGKDESTGIPVKYWIALNSWGTDWGENGAFRILRGENHCEIESFVIGAWGKGVKRRRKKVRVRKSKWASKKKI